jgi:hypothetical protein
MGLYAECQDGALSVCDFIDELAGEGTETAALLMTYCELVFKASQGETGGKQLDKFLNKIENSVRYSLKPNRIEIAFLSYKASMSDSIEPVYLAAKADPNCDAYWIPVPYYELKPDGTAGKMAFEGAEFYPDYIECTDWRQYDIEARRPDAIFTFMPYDDINYVTRVHEDFFCRRLRGLTDMLVYVPYFVVSDDIQEQFASVPGCVYAHKVIVQSEKVRQSYVNAFRKFYGDKFGKAEDKFVALGSPKFDKVINAEKEEFGLPEEWRGMIENGDGTRKPVVLYNNRFTDMTAGIDKQLAKLRHVLDVFKDNPDVVLWWRPHPLNVESLRARSPQYAEGYGKIVDKYLRDGYGIYDDTADLHRAVSRADAYYGDKSSVETLFTSADKIVLHQNTNLMLDWLFVDFVESGNTVWGILHDLSALFSVDLSTFVFRCHGKIPETNLFAVTAHTKIGVINNFVYIIPYNGKNIVRYNIKDETFAVTYRFPAQFNRIAADAKVCGEDIILRTASNLPLMKYNTKTNGITEYAGLSSAMNPNPGGVRFRDLAVDGNIAVLTSAVENTVAELNLETGAYKLHKIGNPKDYYVRVCFDGSDYWLVSALGGIVKWNRETGDTKIFTDFPKGFVPGVRFNFYSILRFNQHIFVFPYEANMILKIDVDTDKIECFAEVDHFNGLNNYHHYGRSVVIGDYIYVVSMKEGLQKICPETGEIENLQKKLSSPDEETIRGTPIFSPPSATPSRVFSESAFVGLQDLINGLKKGEAGNIRREQGAAGSAGKDIYGRVRELCGI